MSREVNDWLTGYLKYTENSEPPISYHTWAGLSLIAGALQRKVYIRWGFEVIYPNLYVVLVGPSGRARKGVALGIAKDILMNLPGVSIAPEATSREALILAMKRSLSNFSDDTTGVIKFHCSITAFSEELSVLLGQSDIKFLANLTDWYDSRERWEYETIGRGKDALQGPCVNLLGATAPDWLQSMLPQEAVGGGFTSRVIFVVEDKKGKTIPKPVLTEAEIELGSALTRDLERINQLAGEMRFTERGEQAYTEWYTREDAALNNGHAAVEDPRFSGYCERRATHLRKLMILVSASRGDDMEITEGDFKRSEKILRSTEMKMHRTFGGLGRARYSDVTERVMDYIKNVGITTRSSLLAKFYRDVDSGTLKIIEEVMQQMGVVKIKLIPDKAEKTYEWIGDQTESKGGMGQSD